MVECMRRICALFHALDTVSAATARRTSPESVKKETVSSKLRAAAQMRIDQNFVSALSETGEGLPSEIVGKVAAIINGRHKTFRYMLLTGLLVAVADKKLHPRCLQVNAEVEGAFDARSLCQKVIVPFEKKMLQGRLGASNEPFANKSARFAMIEKTNNVRKGNDERTLFALYDVLEFVRLSGDEVRLRLFRLALALVGKLPPNKSSVTALSAADTSQLEPERFFSFFEAHTKGVSAVAVLAAFFRQHYAKGTKIKVHPATESGASSKEVGDIDIEFADGRRVAVEVKDKTFTDVDVNHACEKAVAAGVRKVVFAVGSKAEKVKVSKGALTEFWAEKGIDLGFIVISETLGLALSINDHQGRHELANAIGGNLDEMNAPQDVKDLFAKTFKKEGT